MGDEEGEKLHFFIKDEQKWLEVEKYKADIEKYKTEQYIGIINKGIESFQLYILLSALTIPNDE